MFHLIPLILVAFMPASSTAEESNLCRAHDRDLFTVKFCFELMESVLTVELLPSADTPNGGIIVRSGLLGEAFQPTRVTFQSPLEVFSGEPLHLEYEVPALGGVQVYANIYTCSDGVTCNTRRVANVVESFSVPAPSLDQLSDHPSGVYRLDHDEIRIVYAYKSIRSPTNLPDHQCDGPSRGYNHHTCRRPVAGDVRYVNPHLLDYRYLAFNSPQSVVRQATKVVVDAEHRVDPFPQKEAYYIRPSHLAGDRKLFEINYFDNTLTYRRSQLFWDPSSPQQIKRLAPIVVGIGNTSWTTYLVDLPYERVGTE